MTSRTLTIEVPEELIDLAGSPEAAAARAKQALILDLLRDARISQGQAARLLGVSRWDILDLMSRYAVPSGPGTAEEMAEDIAVAQRFAKESEPGARGLQ